MNPERFVDRASVEDFICPICLSVVKDPVVEHMDCAKIFCKTCFDQHELRSTKCPNCNIETKGRTRGMNPLVREKIYMKLLLRCSNRGCSETMCLSELPMHKTVCPFRPLPCTYCLKMVYPDKITKHHSTTCKAFPITCTIPGCKMTVPR